MRKSVIMISVCCFLFTACTNTNNVEENSLVTSVESVAETSQKTDSESVIESSSTDTKAIYFQSDEIVNNLFEAYNSIAAEPIPAEEIQKGSIATKALVYMDDFRMEIINSKRDFLSVSIGTDEKDDSILHDIFINCIKSMDPSITDTDLESAWTELHTTGYMVENYDLPGIKISYMPYKELSSGHSSPRFDFTFQFK